jgi:hypothetical protein
MFNHDNHNHILNFKNWVISMVSPPKEHLSGVTKSAPDEKALSAGTLDACTVK